MAARSWNRRGVGGMGGSLAVLVLVAVLAGLIYAFWDDIRARFAPPEPEEVASEPAPPRDVVEPEPVVKPAPPPRVERHEVAPEPETAVKVSPARRRRAEKARLEAEAALKALDFKRAAVLFKRAAVTLNGTEEAGTYQALSTKATTFGRLTSKVELNPEAEGDLVILRRDVGDMEVVLIDETPESYIVARKGGIRGEIPKEEVRSVERVSKDKYKRRALDEIEKASSAMKERSGVAYYLIAERAYKEGLAGEALKHLDLAYALDGEDLPARLRRYEAGQLLYRAHWSESTGRARTARMWCMKLERLYPDVPELAAEAQELRQRIAEREAREKSRGTYKPTVRIQVRETKPSREATAQADEEITGVQVEQVRATSTRHAKTIAKINELFKEAVDHYVAGRPGNPDSNRHLKLAVKGFDQVVSLCEKVLRDEPRNSEVKNRQADASRYAYHARKMQTLAFGR